MNTHFPFAIVWLWLLIEQNNGLKVFDLKGNKGTKKLHTQNTKSLFKTLLPATAVRTGFQKYLFATLCFPHIVFPISVFLPRCEVKMVALSQNKNIVQIRNTQKSNFTKLIGCRPIEPATEKCACRENCKISTKSPLLLRHKAFKTKGPLSLVGKFKIFIAWGPSLKCSRLWDHTTQN